MKTKRVNARYGNYRGIVIDNLDPLNKGRIKVFVPGIYPKDFEANPDKLPWAEPAMPIFGGGWTAIKGSTNKEVGFNSVPHAGKKGDGAQVWVFFDDGDIRYPIYFAVSQSGPGWFSKHNNQHVLTTDNVSIIIDEYNDVQVPSAKAVAEAEQRVAALQTALDEGSTEEDEDMENGKNAALEEELAQAQADLEEAKKQQQRDIDKVVTKVSPRVSKNMDIQAGISTMNQARMKTRLKINIVTKDQKRDCGVDLAIKGNVNLYIEGNVYKEIHGDIIEYHEGSYRLHRTGPTIEIDGGSTRHIKRGKVNSEEIEGLKSTIVEGQTKNIHFGKVTERIWNDKESTIKSLKQTLLGPADFTYDDYDETVGGDKETHVGGAYRLEASHLKTVSPITFINAGILGCTANVTVNNNKVVINNTSITPLEETVMVGLNTTYAASTTTGVVNAVGTVAVPGNILDGGVFTDIVGTVTKNIAGAEIIAIAMASTKTVGGAATYTYGALTETVTLAKTVTVGGVLTETITGLSTIKYDGGATISGVTTINFENGNNTQTITVGSITATVGSTTYTVVWEPPEVRRVV